MYTGAGIVIGNQVGGGERGEWGYLYVFMLLCQTQRVANRHQNSAVLLREGYPRTRGL